MRYKLNGNFKSLIRGTLKRVSKSEVKDWIETVLNEPWSERGFVVDKNSNYGLWFKESLKATLAEGLSVVSRESVIEWLKSALSEYGLDLDNNMYDMNSVPVPINIAPNCSNSFTIASILNATESTATPFTIESILGDTDSITTAIVVSAQVETASHHHQPHESVHFEPQGILYQQPQFSQDFQQQQQQQPVVTRVNVSTQRLREIRLKSITSVHDQRQEPQNNVSNVVVEVPEVDGVNGSLENEAEVEANEEPKDDANDVHPKRSNISCSLSICPCTSNTCHLRFASPVKNIIRWNKWNDYLIKCDPKYHEVKKIKLCDCHFESISGEKINQEPNLIIDTIKMESCVKLIELYKEKEKELDELNQCLRNRFSEDQVKFLTTNSSSNCGSQFGVRKWSGETFVKALDLYDKIGRDGYKKVVDLGFPFPSIITIRDWKRKINGTVNGESINGRKLDQEKVECLSKIIIENIDNGNEMVEKVGGKNGLKKRKKANQEDDLNINPIIPVTVNQFRVRKKCKKKFS